jgi:hypothetical protein
VGDGGIGTVDFPAATGAVIRQVLARPASDQDRGPGFAASPIPGTSPSLVGLAEQLLGLRIGHELPDLLRAAAGDGHLGRPRQRLLA